MSDRTTVDSGALTMALNALRRAGKDEIADALEHTAVPIDNPRQPIGYASIKLLDRDKRSLVSVLQLASKPSSNAVDSLTLPVFLGYPSLIGKRVGRFHVAVDDDAFVITDGAQVFLTYDASAPEPKLGGTAIHQFNMLAKAIGEAAIGCGLYRQDLEGLSGPQLLMACDDVAQCINSAGVQIDHAVHVLRKIGDAREEVEELVAKIGGNWSTMRLKTIFSDIDTTLSRLDPNNSRAGSAIIDDTHPIAN